MIQFQQGDILHADAEALVNTVNCVGIMGRGIALQFRKEFPENYTAYKVACDRQELQPGKMFVFDLNRLQHPRFIINFPTKRHWKNNSRIEDIQSGLQTLVEEVRQLKIQSIAIPPLGCGLGGLNWNEVRPLIEQAFHSLPEVRVLVYEPAGAPAATEMAKEKKVPKMTIGRAALLGLMRRYLSAVMDPAVSLLEIHKLMYFMQEAGEPLKLNYSKGPYGPYAENLRHVLSAIEGHFINGYGDAEDNPGKQIELKLEAAEQAEAILKDHPATQARFDQVANLIDGFETPFGLELLATVHWIARQEKASGVSDVVAKVYGWNDRKRMFKEPQIQLAWELLQSKG
ncbi:MAG: type II toxin-antitoxin system antitoxin DNA ADP-ribosyl glycohydrolase DarG, partial [Blastocatellia bacterium]